jgi:hypothetical protein
MVKDMHQAKAYCVAGADAMMAWFGRTAEIAVGKTSLLARVAALAACVANVLVSARLALLMTAPVGGDFWWQDGPRPFDAVINGPDHQKTGHFGLTGNLSTGGGTQGIDIIRPTYEVVANARQLNIETPSSGQHFEESIHP